MPIRGEGDRQVPCCSLPVGASARIVSRLGAVPGFEDEVLITSSGDVGITFSLQLTPKQTELLIPQLARPP